MILRVFIPRFHQVDPTPDNHQKSHFVYQIEVSTLGKFFRLEKRYSQFLALHNDLRKSYRTPEFPPKKLHNSSRKVLEQRRRGLECYVQYFVRMNPVPKALLDFLEVPKEDTNAFAWEKPTHQAVAGFPKDQFLHPQSLDNNRLPDIVTQATLDYFYKE